MKIQLLKRTVHDAYSSLWRKFSGDVRIANEDDPDWAIERLTVQKKGNAELSHPLEKAFYGPEYGESTISWPSVVMKRIGPNFIAGDTGNVFLPDGRIVPFADGVDGIGAKTKLRQPIKCFAQKIEGSLFHLTGPNHNNRVHFTLDLLPRLFVAQKFIREQNARILVAPGHKTWQADYLRLFDIPPERIVEGSPGTIFSEDLFFVPLLQDHSRLCDIHILSGMISQMQARIESLGWNDPEDAPDEPFALWISRKDASTRKLLNEEELIEAFSQHFGKIRPLILSGMTFEDQIRSMSRAWCIIGPQGQGFSYGPFLKNKLIILLDNAPSPTSWAATFRDVAETAGNRCIRFFPEVPAPKKNDWKFPAEKLIQNLRDLKPHVNHP